jgi:hypothetical protein
VNSRALVNSETVGADSVSSNSDVVVIVDSLDVFNSDPPIIEDGVEYYELPELFSITMVTGTTAGSHYMVPGAFLTELSSNFDVSYGIGTLIILKDTLTVISHDAEMVYGEPQPEYSIEVTGFKYVDDIESTIASTSYQLKDGDGNLKESTGPIDAGEYEIIPQVELIATELQPGEPGNYVVEYASYGNLLVNKANSNVSVTGGTFTFDGNAKTATGFAYGVEGIEDVLSPAVTFSYSPGENPPVEIGTYEVLASFAGNNNYNPSSASASLTILCRPAAVIQSDFVTAQGGGSSTPLVTAPSGTLPGDLLMVGLMYEKGNTASATPPAGWTLIRKTNQGNNIAMSTYYKVAGTNEPSTYAFELSSSPKWSIGISRIEGADPVNPIDAHAGDSGGQSVSATAPSITTSACNTLVMTFFTSKKDATWTEAAGTTEVYDYPNYQQGLTSNMMAYYIQSDKGATGSKTAIASLSDYWVAQQIAVRPGSTPSGSSAGRTSMTTVTTTNDGGASLVAQPDESQQVANSTALVSYPNPAINEVSIFLPENSPQPTGIVMIDRSGKSYPVPTTWNSENHQLILDVSGLNKGLYILRLATKKGIKFSKILKD